MLGIKSKSKIPQQNNSKPNINADTIIYGSAAIMIVALLVLKLIGWGNYSWFFVALPAIVIGLYLLSLFAVPKILTLVNAKNIVPIYQDGLKWALGKVNEKDEYKRISNKMTRIEHAKSTFNGKKCMIIRIINTTHRKFECPLIQLCLYEDNTAELKVISNIIQRVDYTQKINNWNDANRRPMNYYLDGTSVVAKSWFVSQYQVYNSDEFIKWIDEQLEHSVFSLDQ